MLVLKALKIVNIFEYEITVTTLHYFNSSAFPFRRGKVFHRGLASQKTTIREYLVTTDILFVADFEGWSTQFHL